MPTVHDLKEALCKLGLDQSGRKNELEARLAAHDRDNLVDSVPNAGDAPNPAAAAASAAPTQSVAADGEPSAERSAEFAAAFQALSINEGDSLDANAVERIVQNSEGMTAELLIMIENIPDDKLKSFATAAGLRLQHTDGDALREQLKSYIGEMHHQNTGVSISAAMQMATAHEAAQNFHVQSTRVQYVSQGKTFISYLLCCDFLGYLKFGGDDEQMRMKETVCSYIDLVAAQGKEAAEDHEDFSMVKDFTKEITEKNCVNFVCEFRNTFSCHIPMHDRPLQPTFLHSDF